MPIPHNSNGNFVITPEACEHVVAFNTNKSPVNENSGHINSLTNPVNSENIVMLNASSDATTENAHFHGNGARSIQILTTDTDTQMVVSDSANILQSSCPSIIQLPVLRIPQSDSIKLFFQDHAYFLRTNQPPNVGHDHNYGRNVQSMQIDCANDHTYIRNLPGNVDNITDSRCNLQYELEIRATLKHVCKSCERLLYADQIKTQKFKTLSTLLLPVL